MMHDYTQADIDHQTRTMLDFVAQLTREPSSMKEANVEGLREVGFSDDNILSITLVTCLYNFMTRLADGLGVEFPERGQELVKGWLQSPAREQEWLFAPKSDDCGIRTIRSRLFGVGGPVNSVQNQALELLVLEAEAVVAQRSFEHLAVAVIASPRHWIRSAGHEH